MERWFILVHSSGKTYFWQGDNCWTLHLDGAKFYDSRLTVHRICARWHDNNDALKASAKYDEYVTYMEDTI